MAARAIDGPPSPWARQRGHRRPGGAIAKLRAKGQGQHLRARLRDRRWSTGQMPPPCQNNAARAERATFRTLFLVAYVRAAP